MLKSYEIHWRSLNMALHKMTISTLNKETIRSLMGRDAFSVLVLY